MDVNPSILAVGLKRFEIIIIFELEGGAIRRSTIKKYIKHSFPLWYHESFLYYSKAFPYC
jgi:hypothetical protein